MPSGGELARALERATSVEDLANFDSMMSVLEEAGKRFSIVIDEAIRIATFHLNGKRKLGLALMMTVKHGGDRSRSQRANLVDDDLTSRIDKDRRRRYKALAKVPAEVFAKYLAAKAEKLEIPREAGALRYASKLAGNRPATQPRAPCRRGQPIEVTLTPAMLDVVQRVLGDIDVCIGEAQVKCGCRLQPSTVQAQSLHGTVFVADCLDPIEWIPKLTKLHTRTQIGEVIVALPLQPSASWFKGLFVADWACCFAATEPPVLLAHLGHHHAFNVACTGIGVVLHRLR